ncbi:hypothetical protein [Glutamicibacter sp. X7]
MEHSHEPQEWSDQAGHAYAINAIARGTSWLLVGPVILAISTRGLRSQPRQMDVEK